MIRLGRNIFLGFFALRELSLSIRTLCRED